MKDFIEQISREELAKAGYELRRMPHKSPPIELWEQDERYQRLREEVGGRTRVDPLSFFMLYQFAHQALALPGEVAEVGVYRGGSARMLARIFSARNKPIHLFDTFTGMPPVDANRDGFREGAFSDTSAQEVRDYLSDFPQVRLHPGLFPDTSGPVVDSRFCFVHVDADIYTSVRDCCAFFYERLVPGGVLLFDDYGIPKCAGAKMAVDEFFASRPEHPCYFSTGQSLVIKQ